MKYRNLGKSGLKLSEVSLGSWVTKLSDSDAERIATETVDQASKQASFSFLRTCLKKSKTS